MQQTLGECPPFWLGLKLRDASLGRPTNSRFKIAKPTHVICVQMRKNKMANGTWNNLHFRLILGFDFNPGHLGIDGVWEIFSRRVKSRCVTGVKQNEPMLGV
jgi:hypothetical protein